MLPFYFIQRINDLYKRERIKCVNFSYIYSSKMFCDIQIIGTSHKKLT